MANPSTNGDNALAKLAGTQRAIAEITTPTEAREEIARLDILRQIAEELGIIREDINRIVEQRIHVMRRGGALLMDSGIHSGRPSGNALTLSAFGLDHNESSRWQLLARLDVDQVNQYVMSTIAAGDDLTIAAVLRFAKHALSRPRPTPEQTDDGTDIVQEGSPEPLLRFCLPETPTHVIIQRMLLTLLPDAKTALDVTYGSGAFWGPRTHVQLTAHDLDEQRAPHGVMDFTNLDYDDASYDVVLFDPPHLADGGDDSLMTGRFGTVQGQAELDELILNGTREAWRVCSKGIIVKVTDHVHGRLFQEESSVVSEALNWAVPYDKVYQVRSHAMIDPSWGDQCSAYNNGAVYLVFRKGDQRHIPRRTD